MYEARSAEDIAWIYESIVIEFFLRLKIHNIGTCVPKFAIKNLVFIVSMVTYGTLAMQCMLKYLHFARPGRCKKNSIVDRLSDFGLQVMMQTIPLAWMYLKVI